ncbi:hypothetical protein D3C71_1789770 [compost metagenome]
MGMPRSRLITPPLKLDRYLLPETRISAHTSPSTVDSASEPSVTRIVSFAPSSSIGMNSAASLKNSIMTQPTPTGLPAGAPDAPHPPARATAPAELVQLIG